MCEGGRGRGIVTSGPKRADSDVAPYAADPLSGRFFVPDLVFMLGVGGREGEHIREEREREKGEREKKTNRDTE